MRIPVGLSGPIMFVVGIEVCKLFEPCVDILYQSGFRVVHKHGIRDLHRRNQDPAFLDSALFEYFLDLRSNVNVVPAR